jgi:Tol biopolymer transport system component
MSTPDRLERDITAWFGETAAPRPPEYTDDILRQTARSRQRPRWTFPERWFPMSVITFGRVTLRPVPWRTVGLLVALALLLAVAAAVYVGSNQHRVPAPFGVAANGLVAYSKDGDIYTVDPTTGARQAIVTGATVDGGPAYSRDGTRLAFSRTMGTGSVIVLADADGGNQVVIPMTPLAEVSQSAWSPDGRWVAVAASDGDTGSLWLVDTVARTIRKIEGLVLDDEALLWRPPDGGQLAVVARDDRLGQLQFALVTPGVDKLDFLAPVGYLGSQFRAGGWTPDGSRFVYASDPPWGQVHVVDVVGGHDVQIQPSMAGNGTIYPRLSNDGRRVLSMEQGPEGKTWLSVAPTDGSTAAVRVSDLYGDGIGIHYSWAPDDRSIEFEPNVGPHVVLDPAGGPATTPSWVAEGAESWQRRAP